LARRRAAAGTPPHVDGGFEELERPGDVALNLE
jgi:hypothetical protein